MLTNEQLEQYATMSTMVKIVRGMHDDMKYEVDHDFGVIYEQTGIRTRDVKIDGVKVAALTWVPGKEPETRKTLSVIDQESLEKWAEEKGYVRRAVDMAKVSAWFMETGELPDGCDVIETSTGGKRGYVRVTPEKSYRKALEAEINTRLLGAAESEGENA